MRILLDENIDRFLEWLFDAELDVVTVQERGWGGRKNGDLLRLAALEFDAFVTMDKNLEYQQNLSDFDLAVVVLRAPRNAFSVVAPLIPNVNLVLKTIQAGEVAQVE